jgi:iron complex outermembrane receptor protein
MRQLKSVLRVRRPSPRQRLIGVAAALIVIATSTPRAVLAQAATPQTPAAASPQAGQPAPRVPGSTVIVTAQKEPADAATLPVSITAVTRDVLEDAGITAVSDAARYAPNAWFSEFTARKLSNARFRGIGSSPANPGITTFIDGVPQLNTNSSSLEFIDVRQVEFVRGPQSALFGRNTLGGLVNIESGRPSLAAWTGGLSFPVGNRGARDVRGVVSGPVTPTLGVSFAMGGGERDGFTKNDITGHLLDSRSATFGKGQILWTPTHAWETRVIVSGERARDGDYALNDLAALRKNPFHTQRNFEGRTDRDVLATTVMVRHEGSRFVLSSTTGWVRWKTRDITDLDYTPLALATRDNAEKDVQLTQEVRLASAAAVPVKLSGTTSLKWQTGLFAFRQNYDQNAVNTFAPFLLSPFLGFAVSQQSPLASLDDNGVGVYGQGTVTFHGRLDLTAGARIDHENKHANLKTFYSPAIFSGTTVTKARSFSDVSPQFAVAYRAKPDRTVFVTVGRGFKAGGFNPTSPVGSEEYDRERTWNVEGGLKTSLADGRLSATASVFYIQWDDMQLNVPNPFAPGDFYIANVGGARSRGIEFEAKGRPCDELELFGGVGYTHARFADGTKPGGVSIAGKTVPNTPGYNASLGVEVTRVIGRGTIYGRAEVTLVGAFEYNDANTAHQDAYSLTDFRAGVRVRHTFAEIWVRNAFDTRYVPLAFAYPNFAASGFIGENGRPRTFGVRLGVTF